MALIECPECKTPVSDKAAACVTCGYPLTKVSPRFDGIYVSKTCTETHGELPGDWLGNMFRKMSRTQYVRAYARFYEDGLLVYAGAVVSKDSAPARPALHRTWGDQTNRLQWIVEDGRLRIISSNGFVTSATLESDRLRWNIRTSPDDEVFDFVVT